jgi:hypothetical protein
MTARRQGQVPSISTSSEKLRNVLMRTISPRTPTFFQRGSHGDGSYDVGVHQELQPQQDAASEDGPDDPVGLLCFLTPDCPIVSAKPVSLLLSRCSVHALGPTIADVDVAEGR